MRTLPNDLPDLLTRAGLTVVEIPGWQTRGRPPSSGAFNPVGVLWHHTGGAADGRKYADWLFLTGRSDLPAPLCQLSIDRSGVVYVGAAGRANHAGKAKASGSVAAGDGNALYVGVECQNTGSEGWTSVQYTAMVRTGAVLAKVLGTSVAAQRAHKETSVTGKWDPGLLDMDQFRADVAYTVARLAEATSKPAPAKSKTPNLDRAIPKVRDAIKDLKGTGQPGVLAGLRAALAKMRANRAKRQGKK